MRVLFVSSAIHGGSGRSQRELARRLIDRGHEVRILTDDGRSARPTRWLAAKAAAAAVRFGDGPGNGIRWISHRPGRRSAPGTIDEVVHLFSPVPENAFLPVAADWHPQVVVGNSLTRWSWRQIRAHSAEKSIPTVLYVREVTTLAHFEVMDDPADVLVANARSLMDAVTALGHECHFLPSVIITADTVVQSTREVALLVNPVESHGVGVALAAAGKLPEIEFVLQESWELDSAQLASVERGIAGLPNVALRRRRPPGPDLYGRARVLLVPHQIDNRPRVIAEAHANAIPVLATGQAGLVEAVARGGEIIASNDASAWADAIRRFFDEDAHYVALCAAAFEESRRPEIDPDVVAARFEEILALALASR